MIRTTNRAMIVQSLGPAVLLLTVFFTFSSTSALGASFVLERKFSNCAALNKVYPGGVAKNSKVTNRGGATNYSPVVKPKIYKANSSKDRDKDGIACER